MFFFDFLFYCACCLAHITHIVVHWAKSLWGKRNQQFLHWFHKHLILCIRFLWWAFFASINICLAESKVEHCQVWFGTLGFIRQAEVRLSFSYLEFLYAWFWAKFRQDFQKLQFAQALLNPTYPLFIFGFDDWKSSCGIFCSCVNMFMG